MYGRSPSMCWRDRYTCDRPAPGSDPMVVYDPIAGGGVSINNCRWGKVLERKTSGRWDRNGMGMRVPTPLVMTRVRHRGRGGRAAGNRAGRSSGTRGGVPESRGRDLGRVLWATVTRAEVLGNPREGQRHLTWVFS